MTGQLTTKQELSLFNVPGCCFSPNGLEIEAGLDFETWERLGEILRGVEGAVQWWLGDWCNYGESVYGEKYSQALEATDYDCQTLRTFAYISNKYDLLRRRNNLSWSHHRDAATLEPTEQDELLDLAEKERLSSKDFRKAIKQRKAKQRINLPSTVDDLNNITSKYSVIYADPPWQYRFTETDNRKIENHYPTMELEQICELPISGIADDDSILFLWATSPKLAEAIKVIESWSFDYKTCAVWDKQKIGMGYYFRQRHELLLVATRGEPGTPDQSARPASVFSYPRGEHSAKPLEFYQVIETMYPNLNKIELFCRTPREGWSVWGNQAGI